MDEGVNFHLIFLFCLVQNEIRCQKHEVCKFIPLWFVTFQGKLKYESAHSTSRMQNTNSLAAVFFHRPFEIRFHLFNEGLKTLLPLFLPFLRPLPVEWLDSRPHFDDVGGFHCHRFQAHHSVGQLVVLKQVLVFSHNKIQDLLVREDGFFEILNPGFSEVFWEIS